MVFGMGVSRAPYAVDVRRPAVVIDENWCREVVSRSGADGADTRQSADVIDAEPTAGGETRTVEPML